MKIRLLWVGKTKESWIAEGIKKYMALLKPMARVTIIEAKEERGKVSGTEAAISKEAVRIIKQAGEKFILLDEGGASATSPELAKMLNGRDEVTFVIGGPYGVNGQVRQMASETLSLSPMTFTHQMARVVLIEQIYRALMIINRRSYHN